MSEHPEPENPAGLAVGQDDGVLPSSRVNTGAVEVSIVPPPPSAPGEFLVAQWLDPFPPDGIASDQAQSLTPPPPSAPGEFLSAQWWDAELVPPEGSGLELAVFEAAYPLAIERAEELEALAALDAEEADESGLERGNAEGEPQAGPQGTFTARVRGVPLAAGEEIAKVFLPENGVVNSVPPTGQALILTNRRLIAFRGMEGFRDTHMAASSEISQCSVRTGQRNWGAILQGIMIMVGGAFLYLIVGYWLAGQISGPNVPVLNIDVAPLIALLIVLAGLFILMQNYFTRPAGAMIFHGDGMEIAFPFRSSLDLQQVYDFVDLAQQARERAPVAREDPEDNSR